MQKLLLQLHYELRRFNVKKKSIETVFIGGGTPSTIAPHLFEKIFETLTPYLQENAEITTEANPNSATETWLKEMYTLGVNRISFGVQSFDPDKLKLLNRAHSPHQAQEAVQNAFLAGFEHISIDLIYGVFNDTRKLLQKDLENTFSLPIDHLSAYSLTIESGTPFEKKPHMAHEKIAHTQWLFETIASYGFKQYEISNFGRYRSKHNLGYWQYADYIGIGSGAVGKLANTRFYPQTDIESYIENPLKIHQEILEEKEMIFEKIFLGLRSIVGVKRSLLNTRQRKQADILAAEKKLLLKKDRYFNPDFLLADEIALFLDS